MGYHRGVDWVRWNKIGEGIATDLTGGEEEAEESLGFT